MNDPRDWTFKDWCNLMMKAIPAFFLASLAYLSPIIVLYLFALASQAMKQ